MFSQQRQHMVCGAVSGVQLTTIRIVRHSVFSVVNSGTALDVVISETYSERVCAVRSVLKVSVCIVAVSSCTVNDSHNYDASLFVNLRCATRTSFRSYCVL